MIERYEERLAAASGEAEEAGLGGIVVTPSPDLVYLTGYDPPPPERLTMLVVAPRSQPVLLVPELERPRALDSPLGERLEVTAWADGEDPYAAAARVLSPEGTYGVTDRMWASHVIGLQRELPGDRPPRRAQSRCACRVGQPVGAQIATGA